MRTDITHALPPVVADHIAAYNTHNPDALMATFAADALLNDARREFLGLDAIRAWADKEIFGDNVTLVVERALEQMSNNAMDMTRHLSINTTTSGIKFESSTSLPSGLPLLLLLVGT